jgi:hypothetical protein
MTLGVKSKPRLSGAQRRKIARADKVAAAVKKSIAGELIPLDLTNAPNTYDEWRREGREVYWEMRKRKLDMESGKALTWAADMNARMAKMAEELRELQYLRQQLAALQGAPPAGLITSDRDAINSAVAIRELQEE